MVTVSDWVATEIVGNPKNKSAKVEELIIKGFMAEKLAEADLKKEENKSAFYQFITNDLTY